MTELMLTEEEKVGAKRISDWLHTTAAEEGDDRPVFRTIAQYIVSDIEEALGR